MTSISRPLSYTRGEVVFKGGILRGDSILQYGHDGAKIQYGNPGQPCIYVPPQPWWFDQSVVIIQYALEKRSYSTILTSLPV